MDHLLLAIPFAVPAVLAIAARRRNRPAPNPTVITAARPEYTSPISGDSQLPTDAFFG